MMIIMHPGAPREQVDQVIVEIEKQQLSAHVIEGVEQTIVGAVGDGHAVPKEIFEALPGVLSVHRISQPYKLASRQFHEQDSIFQLDGSPSAEGRSPSLQVRVRLNRGPRYSRSPRPCGRRERMPCARCLQTAHFPVFLPGSG